MILGTAAVLLYSCFVVEQKSVADVAVAELDMKMMTVIVATKRTAEERNWRNQQKMRKAAVEQK